MANENLPNLDEAQASGAVPAELLKDLPSAVTMDEIVAFCTRNSIARLSLFGSILRDDFTPESDVVVLVEFLPGKTPGMFGMVRMQIELTTLFGRVVDFRTANELTPYFCDSVLARARLLHAA